MTKKDEIYAVCSSRGDVYQMMQILDQHGIQMRRERIRDRRDYGSVVKTIKLFNL